jgi:hypothetical protein
MPQVREKSCLLPHRSTLGDCRIVVRLLTQDLVLGQEVYGAVISTNQQLTALRSSDFTALTVLRLERLSDDATLEITAILTALAAPTSLVWLSLPWALSASAACALDYTQLRDLTILGMR